MNERNLRYLKLLPVIALAMLATAFAVLPQLQARVFGHEYVVRVAAVDPIDPFRGPYVQLSYPDLVPSPGTKDPALDGTGTVFVPLIQRGELWVGGKLSSERPSEGPYIACRDRHEVTCGVQSFFVTTAKARAIERRLGDNDAVAVLRVDRRGNVAVVDVK